MASAQAELEVDVDVDFDARPAPSLAPQRAPSRTSTAPGLGAAPVAKRDYASSWEAPSVVATWPVHDPLDATESGGYEPGPTNGSAATASEFARDLPLGAKAGQPDDPSAILELLRTHGIFEPESANSPAWTRASDVERVGTRLKATLAWVWASTLMLVGGGYLGWEQWVAHRHAIAAQYVAEAKADALEGDYAKLVDAERLLRLARDKHPRSVDIPRLELFVHQERVLESGSRELSPLRASLVRAEAQHVDPGYLAAARSVLAAYSGTPDEAAAALKEALERAKADPLLLYVLGRVQQRLAQPDGKTHLQAAASAAPDLIAAQLALAEMELDARQDPEALAAFDAILQRKPDQLRAQLWHAFLTADADDPAQAMKKLESVAREAKNGAPVDRILWGLARSRLLLRSGASIKAGEAVRETLAAGASEPHLLALIANEARRTGQLAVAQQAASQAVAAAPNLGAYRALLANILIMRHDGQGAYNMLAALPADEPAVAVMRARAALLTFDPQALKTALDALDARVGNGKPGVEVASLRLRLHAALEPNPKLLQEGKALLHHAPGDPDALRAVGEIALALREPHEAVSAFEQLVAMTPDDAEAHHLLGRARRMATDIKGAEASLRRALDLAPGYAAALVTLGSLLLDTGRYEDADAVYQELAARDVRDGRLGRAEALLGLGRVDDAQAQLTGLPEAQRDNPGARETAAKVALARKKPGEALTFLRPLMEGEHRDPEALVLYGDALYAADQVNPAAGAYDAVLEIDPEYPEALLGRGEVDLRAEKFGEAVDVLLKAKSSLETRLRGPDVRVRMLSLLGRAYVQRAKRGDLELARDLLREAVKQPSATAEAFFWLGEALGGRITPESAAAFKRYIELEPNGDYVPRAKRALGPLL